MNWKPETKPNERAISFVRQMFSDAEQCGPDTLRAVWRLLTALRGPDNGDEALKYETTRHIRMCLLTDSMAINVGVANPYDYSTLPKNYIPAKAMYNMVTSELNHGPDHFMLHIESAVSVLVAAGFPESNI